MATADDDIVQQVPAELRELLIQFSMAYLMDRPDDLIDYAVLYMRRLQDQHHNDERRLTHDAHDSMHTCPVITNADDSYAQLFENMRRMSIFRTLSDCSLREIVTRATCRAFARDEVVFRKDDIGNTFYIVKNGRFEVYRKGKLLKIYENSGSFGELSLLYAAPRNCTIRAATDGTLWEIDRICFRTTLFLYRAKYDQVFSNIEHFKHLSANDKIKLADAIVERKFTDGEKIYGRGEVANGVYFLQKGRVRLRTVMQDENGGIEIQLDEGEVFGELGIFADSRVTSAFAVGNVQAAFLDIETINRLIGNELLPILDS